MVSRRNARRPSLPRRQSESGRPQRGSVRRVQRHAPTAIVLALLCATAVAFVAQTWAQARLSATRAAVVMTMEPVFAGIFGVLVGGDELGARTVVGAALVLAAMYVVELSPRRRKVPPVERLES